MNSDENFNLPSLEDLLPETLRSQLGELSPGISWALDALVVSFGEEIKNLDASAVEAFGRLTLNYGESLQRFLKLAHAEGDLREEMERKRKMALLRDLDLFSGLNVFDLGQIQMPRSRAFGNWPTVTGPTETGSTESGPVGN